jgi:signal peptidase II
MLDPQPARAPEAPSEAPSTSLRSRIASRWRNDALFFAIAITIVVVDQITKSIVRENLRVGESWPEGWEFIRIIHVTNSGAAFGILQDQTTFLIITSTLGLAAIVLYYIYPPMDHGLIRVALGMQLGGAVGNLIDRVRLGEVTDFVDVGQFPTFNVADSSISISITAVLIFFLLQEFDRPKPPDTIHAAGDD